MQQGDPILDKFHPASYLLQCRQLNVHDAEYRRIAYSLSAALGTNALHVVSVHALHSPHHDAKFDAQHVAVTLLDSWVNGRDLPEENTVAQMVHHGGRFRIGDANKGAVFRVGQIDLDPAAAPPGLQQYEFVHFRLATGRSFVVDPQQVGAHGIPSGYDSIVIHRPLVEDVAREGYIHEYILSDESRIYADYVINFVVDINELPIQPSPRAELPLGGVMCPQHPNVPLQFWDPVTHVAICVYCKMQGSHSYGDNATHKLTALPAAFQASMADLRKEHEVINERCQTIHTQLASVAQRMEAVNNNHMRCHDQIYEIVQRVVQVLHEETQSKLSALLSDEAELKRQLEYYQFMDNFLGAQRQSLDPVEFLQAYGSHSSLIADAPSEIVDAAANVRADITVVGRIDLVVDDNNPATWTRGGQQQQPPQIQQQPQRQQAAAPPPPVQQHGPPQPAPSSGAAGFDATPGRAGSRGRAVPTPVAGPSAGAGGGGGMLRDNSRPRFRSGSVGSTGSGGGAQPHPHHSQRQQQQQQQQFPSRAYPPHGSAAGGRDDFDPYR